MHHAIRRAFLLALIFASALMAGCGQAMSPGGSQQASSSATPGVSDGLIAGQVTLTLDNHSYKPGDTIAVTIHNGLSKAIWAADHKTSCTILTAEHLQDGQWQAVGACRLMTPTVMMPLAAASATVQHLFVAQGAGWPTGIYRVTLTYSGGDEGTGAPGGAAYSAQFTIG